MQPLLLHTMSNSVSDSELSLSDSDDDLFVGSLGRPRLDPRRAPTPRRSIAADHDEDGQDLSDDEGMLCGPCQPPPGQDDDDDVAAAAAGAASGAPLVFGHLPQRSLITIHGLNMNDLRKALMDDHGVTPEEDKTFKRKAQLIDKARSFVTAAGHAFTTEKNRDAVPFADARPSTTGKHYANWRKDDMYVTPEQFVGRLGPKVRRVSECKSDPESCWRFFHTKAQIELIAKESSRYAHNMNNLDEPPGWFKNKDEWPPKWLLRHVRANPNQDAFSPALVEKYLGLMYITFACGKNVSHIVIKKYPRT
eukprot:SAG11_NODE_1163_length_5624_cov_7.819186_1_plen_307_part_00